MLRRGCRRLFSQPISRVFPNGVQHEPGIIKSFRLLVGAEVAVGDDGRTLPWLRELYPDELEGRAEIQEVQLPKSTGGRLAAFHGYVHLLLAERLLHLPIPALRHWHVSITINLGAAVAVGPLQGSALVVFWHRQGPCLGRSHLDPLVVSGKLDDGEAQQQVARLKGGSGSALQRCVRRLVDLLVAEARVRHAAGGEPGNNALHAPLRLLVLLRFQGIAQNIAAGAGQLADHLQVHAGPPPPEDLDVVLTHAFVALCSPCGEAALPTAVGIFFLGAAAPGAWFRMVRKAETAGAVGLDAAVFGVLVHQ